MAATLGFTRIALTNKKKGIINAKEKFRFNQKQQIFNNN
jgi:hypothetical protein